MADTGVLNFTEKDISRVVTSPPYLNTAVNIYTVKVDILKFGLRFSRSEKFAYHVKAPNEVIF